MKSISPFHYNVTDSLNNECDATRTYSWTSKKTVMRQTNIIHRYKRTNTRRERSMKVEANINDYKDRNSYMFYL
jgi:hypothetical protein